jgi:transcriptional regulator with XRE-family HTH domain
VDTDQLIAFGPVLTRYRVASGLTQEELAERAGLSVRGISDLERGVNRSPRAHTVRQLADALQLSADDRASFERAAREAGTTPRPVDAPPEGNFLGALPSGTLIGREDELLRIRAALDAATDGKGNFLLLGGEAGVGKTRLLQEMMAEVRTRGLVVLTGRCQSTDRATSCAPVLEALAEVAAAAPAAMRAETQRAGKRVRTAAAGLPAGDRPDPGAAAEQHLFVAVRDLLLLIARAVPLVLLLDDLQWADAATLLLLQRLAEATRSSRIVLAAGFREERLAEDHPELARMLQTLSRERLAERLTVRRLSLEETAALVGALMEEPAVSDEFSAFVYRRTKGNPRLIDQLVRSLGGRLELQGEIGAGSMGRVFRAIDRETGDTVAAKLVLARTEIDLDALLHLQQEGAVLSRLRHPHIVTVIGTFLEEHASCIIMELLDGESLGSLLRAGPLSPARAKHLALQVADALSYAHAQSIVHRDIKPDNVMVLAEDQVKVTDFGIARILQPDTSLQTIATTGMRMGTPLYMAPEQIEGKKIDGRTDIYALGAMLYHMVTGRPPFEGSDALAVAVKHLQEEASPPSRTNPDLPPEWDALILKAMAKDPARRFQSASEMARALDALPITARGDRAARASRWKRPAGIAGGLAAVIAAAAILLTAVVLHPRSTGAQVPPGLARRLDGYLTALAKQNRVSGAVLIARGGQMILDKGYGLADRQYHVPNGPTVIYPSIASFNVNLTAAVRLEEEGKLHATDLICRYLTGCPSI